MLSDFLGIVILALISVVLVAAGILIARWVRREPKMCGTCAHFDAEEGQAVIDKFPMFKAAAQHISPSQMGVPVEYAPCDDCDGSGKKPDESEDNNECYQCGGTGEVKIDKVLPPGAEKVKWSDYGACLNGSCVGSDGHGQLIDKSHLCEHYKRGRHRRAA